MKKKYFLDKIIELFVSSERSTTDWKKDKGLMTVVYAWTYLIIAYAIYRLTISLLFTQLSKSVVLTNIFRISHLGFVSVFILCLGLLTYKYYRFILIGHFKIYFINIISFYLASIYLFGGVYYLLYYIDSNLFVSSINLPVHTETYTYYGVKAVNTTFKFYLYSAMQSVTGNFKAISSNSIIVSIYNYLQNIYTISIISLLVSSFVNRNSNRIDNIT